MRILTTPRIAFNEYMKTKGITSDNIEGQDKVAFISINNTIDDVEPYFPEDRKNLKVIFFDDVSEDIYTPDLKNPGEMLLVKAMTEEQAIELYSFIKTILDKELVIVHCTAGVSRSGAVATFINDLVRGDWESFKRNNSSIQPNTHVYALLKKAWDVDTVDKEYFTNNSKP